MYMRTKNKNKITYCCNKSKKNVSYVYEKKMVSVLQCLVNFQENNVNKHEDLLCVHLVLHTNIACILL